MFDNNRMVIEEFNEYDHHAASTDLMSYGGLPNPVYYALKLAGEAGEVAEKIAKVYRDDRGEFSEQKRAEIAKELGDVLWYLSRLACYFGFTLAMIAAMNVKKIFDRKARGVTGGSGDDR